VQGVTLEATTDASKRWLQLDLVGRNVTLGTPLANGGSLNLQFLLGIQQTGKYRFFIIVEALP
jgi:hypothetical protein